MIDVAVRIETRWGVGELRITGVVPNEGPCPVCVAVIDSEYTSTSRSGIVVVGPRVASHRLVQHIRTPVSISKRRAAHSMSMIALGPSVRRRRSLDPPQPTTNTYQRWEFGVPQCPIAVPSPKRIWAGAVSISEASRRGCVSSRCRFGQGHAPVVCRLFRSLITGARRIHRTALDPDGHKCRMALGVSEAPHFKLRPSNDKR